MKFKTCLATMVIAFLGTNTAFAMQNEPDGFRGITWGASTSTVQGLIETSDAQQIQRFIGKQVGLNLNFPIKSYIRSSDKREFDGTPVLTTVYTFYKDQFVGATISYQSTIDIHPAPGQKYPNYQSQGYILGSLDTYFGPSDSSKLSFFEKLKNFGSGRPTYSGEKTDINNECKVINPKSSSTSANCFLEFKSVALSNQAKQDWKDYLEQRKGDRDEAKANAKARESAKPDF